MSSCESTSQSSTHFSTRQFYWGESFFKKPKIQAKQDVQFFIVRYAFLTHLVKRVCAVGSGKDKKKRIRRTREEIDMDEQFSAAGRRKTKKRRTSWDKHVRPVVRLNFVWHYERLKIINAVADELDVTTEAFIRQAVYSRCVMEKQSSYSTCTTYKRVLSGRYFQRADVQALSWRWREPNIELADEVAQKIGLDLKTFIDLAVYEHAVHFAENGEMKSILRKIARYLDSIKDDPEYGDWAKTYIAHNPDFVDLHSGY